MTEFKENASKIELTPEFKEWKKKLEALNEKINGLNKWDDYAERLQSRYDELLTEDPRFRVKD